MSDLGQTFNGCTFFTEIQSHFRMKRKVWMQYVVGAVCHKWHVSVTLSVFNYMGSFENEILSLDWKSCQRCIPRNMSMIYMASHSDLYGLLHPLMKPSFIHFNCNILSHYGLVKWNLKGRLVDLSQVQLCYVMLFTTMFIFLCLMRDSKIANVFKLSVNWIYFV